MIAKNKLEVVHGIWIVNNPRCTPSFNTLTTLLIKMGPMNQNRTHVLVPGDQSLQLRKAEQQDNLVVEAIEDPFPGVLRSR
jgi:hypothetical protein